MDGADPSIKLRIHYEFTAYEMNVSYFDKETEQWHQCLTVTNIHRYFDLNYHHISLTGVSNNKKRTIITLEDATLTEKKMYVDKSQFDKLSKKLSDKMVNRVKQLDKAFDNGDLNPETLLEKQGNLLKHAKTLAIFSKDFHDGVMKFQEFLLHSINRIEGKEVDDISALKGITDKIKQLEERQSTIYLKF